MPTSLFNGRYQIFSGIAGGTGEYVVSGLFFDETAVFASINTSVGNVIYDAIGNRYEVIAINTPTPLNVDVNYADSGSTVAPSAGAGVIYEPTSNFDITITTRTSNSVTEFLQRLMVNQAMEDVDKIVTDFQDKDIKVSALPVASVSNAYIRYSLVDGGGSVVGRFLPLTEDNVNYFWVEI